MTHLIDFAFMMIVDQEYPASERDRKAAREVRYRVHKQAENVL
jgi:hypothetical protein